MTLNKSQDLGLSNYSYDALIFDCDGTLVNSAPLHYQAFEMVLKDHGLSISKMWYLERIGLSSEMLLTDSLRENNVSSVDVISLVKKAETYFIELASSVLEIKEATDIVRSLYKKTPMAVASSGSRNSVIKSLESVGLLDFFDHIITSEDVIEHKPSPEIFLTTAKKLGVSPGRCVVFEDSIEGIEAANRAGTKVIDIKQHASIYKHK